MCCWILSHAFSTNKSAWMGIILDSFSVKIKPAMFWRLNQNNSWHKKVLPNKWWNSAKLYKKKKKQRARTKVQASKHPKRGRPQGGKGTTKNQTNPPPVAWSISTKEREGLCTCWATKLGTLKDPTNYRSASITFYLKYKLEGMLAVVLFPPLWAHSKKGRQFHFSKCTPF